MGVDGWELLGVTGDPKKVRFYFKCQRA